MNNTNINSTFNPEEEQFYVSVFFVLMQFVNFFIGIPLNIYVIVLLSRAGGLDESVFFAVSQSVSEILYALSAPLYILCVAGICYSRPQNFSNAIGVIARLMFQCLVCVERYLAVVHPVTFLKFKPLKYRLLCLIAAWMYVLICSIILIFPSSVVLLNFYGSFDIYILVVEVFCCVSILKILKHPAPGQRGNSGWNNTKKKAFKIVLTNLLSHLIQSMPYIVLFTFEKALPLNTLIKASSNTMAMNIAGGLLPPLFFLHRAGKLKIKRPLLNIADHTTNFSR